MTAGTDPLVQAVIDAWVVEGPHPEFHRQAKNRLRDDWPTLSRAIVELIDGRRGMFSTQYECPHHKSGRCT